MDKKTFAFVILILAICGASGYWFGGRGASPALSAEYYAVLLSNGSVYFGRLEALDSPHPVLRDVYYVQTGANPQTKEVNSVLIKRGAEWHAPDRMILQPSSIVFMEPVAAGSRVSQLIAESRHR
jgi:uncharacterized protein YpmB